jgi:hypothetical protein
VTAVTLQRTIPALAASAVAPAGPWAAFATASLINIFHGVKFRETGRRFTPTGVSLGPEEPNCLWQVSCGSLGLGSSRNLNV